MKMKMTPWFNHTGGIAALAILSSFAITPAARAQLNLRYEEAFGTHAAGSAFSGPFRINLQDFDMGTLYPSLGTPGTAAGYGQNATGTTIQGGINALDALQTAGAVGARSQPTVINGVSQASSNGMDDSWGIARILTITDMAGGVVWSEAHTNQQLTVMFYGEKDFYVNQLANGFQEIDGVGLHANIYLQNKNAVDYTAYNPFLGSAGRTGIDTFTTVTDGAMIMSTVSTAGFLHNAGTLGGLATEFISVFNASSGGTGQTYLNVTGGTQMADFNTNSFHSDYVPGVTADLFAQFTTVPNIDTANWLVNSNDPVQGVAVPEPSTYGLFAAMTLAGIVALRRRVRQATIA